MRPVLESKLASIQQEYKELSTPRERFEFLNLTIGRMDQQNKEDWSLFRTQVKDGELNVDPSQLQLDLEENELAIGRIQLWLMEEMANTPDQKELSPTNIEGDSVSEPQTKIEPVVEPQLEKKYMNAGEVAQYLGISEHTIKLWASRNQIPVSQLNAKHNRFIKNEIDAWVLKNKKKLIK